MSSRPGRGAAGRGGRRAFHPGRFRRRRRARAFWQRGRRRHLRVREHSGRRSPALRRAGAAAAAARGARDRPGPACREELRRRAAAAARRRSRRSTALDDLARRARRGSARPAILKTRRFGYDGKGQVRIDAPRRGRGSVGRQYAARPACSRRFVDFDAEFSILLCRGADGEIALWDAPENVHRGGILERSRVPAHPELARAIPAGRSAGAADRRRRSTMPG